MKEKRKNSSNEDLPLLKVELKKIVEKKPPNERIISYFMHEE
jgi:hypothetical protein